jgi:hypothetical protein
MASFKNMKQESKPKETVHDRLIRESIDKIGKALEKAIKEKEKNGN